VKAPTQSSEYGLFKVGNCFVKPTEGIIIRDDRQISISPRNMAILQILWQRAGEIVSGRTLLEELWPRNHSGGNAVYKAINELRSALGDGTNGREYIETFPRKGYKLVAEVKSITPGIDGSSADELFRRGVFQRRRLDLQGLTAAQSYLRAAIALAPDYLAAYSELAGTILELALFDLRANRRAELRQEYLDVLGEVEAKFPESSITKEIKSSLSRLNQATFPDIERGLRDSFLEDQKFNLFFIRYAELLFTARLPEFANRYLDEYCRRNPEDPYREIFRPGIVRDLGDLDECIRLRKNLLDTFPNEIGTLSALVGELTKAGKITEAQQYLSHLHMADSEGFWYRTVSSMHRALTGAYDYKPMQIAKGGGAKNLARGALAFIYGDIDSGSACWRSLEPEVLMTATRYIVGVDYVFPRNVTTSAQYKALLDDLGIGATWTRYMKQRVRELEPHTGIS